MKTRILTQTFVLALAMMVTLTIGSSVAFGQDGADKQSTGSRTDSRAEARDNALVGVWEEVDVPAFVDCQTGLPDPTTPIIRALYSFNQGGTMYVEDTIPFEGPFRTTGGGIWKRTSGRNYTYSNVHYSFDGKMFIGIVKSRANLKLSRDGDSFTENGTFEVLDSNGNPFPEPISGCFTARAHRLRF